MINSGDIQSLLKKLRAASPGTIFLLADGLYTLARNQSVEVNTPRVTIRSASGNRDAVILEGGYNNVSINTDDVTVADVTLRNAKDHSIQVRGEKGIKRTSIYNVHLVDSGQQFVKVSAPADGTSGQAAEDGLVACSLVEYTTYSRGNGTTAPSYTNGVDILAGKGWTIRDNVFRRIRSQAGPVGPSIYLGRNTTDSVVQRNLLVDCWRGIALGLSAPGKFSRGGPQVQSDHQNGLVENNVFLALHEPADAAIENNYALNSRIVHNTAYYNENLKHAVSWAIEYRFPPTAGIVIQNNLTNRPIVKRRPAPIEEATIQGNITNATPAWFRDLANEDVHLVEHVPAIDAGVQTSESLEDMDGEKRLVGPGPDAGADEYTGLAPKQEAPPPPLRSSGQ
ncbi:MAG: hypothetical protein AB7N91_21225 [Candidatus Tectimicrobiota bacterium]